MRFEKKLFSLLLVTILTVSAPLTSVAQVLETPDEEVGESIIAADEVLYEEQAVTDQPEEPVSEIPVAAGDEAVSENIIEVEEGTWDISDNANNDGAFSGGETDELPYGFRGMPDGYVLDDEQINLKSEMRENAVLDDIKGATAGEDYEEQEIVFCAESHNEAETIAAAYNATLKRYEAGVAVARLSNDVNVSEAIEISQDDRFNMPPISPNRLTELKEPIVNTSDGKSGSMFATSASQMPKAGDYTTWVLGEDGKRPLLNNPDIYLKNTISPDYQWQHEMVDTFGAWSVTMGDPSIKVAVIDTGVNGNHEDLGGRVEYVKVGTIETTAQQDHGTHCAGIIAATAGNGKGGAGIAPGVKIISLNIFGSSNTYKTEDFAVAIGLAIQNKADIISMSIGGPGYDATVQQMLDSAYANKVTAIAAMGNDGSNVKNFPAAYNHVIAVTSINKDGRLSEFSSYGSWADIAAPGSHIMSTVRNGYDNFSGTSMATPVVAGVSALYMSRYGHTDPDVMEKLLKRSATKVNSSGAGKGIVNAYNLFAKDNVAPSVTVYDSENNEITDLSKSVPTGSYFIISRGSVNSSAEKYYTLYTTDGSAPSVKNGEIVNGNCNLGDIRVSLDRFESGSAVNIRARIINGLGSVSKETKLKVYAPDRTAAGITQKAKIVTLSSNKLIMGYRPGKTESFELRVTQLKDVNGSDIVLPTYPHEWVSSNTDVIGVTESADGNAVLVTRKEGSAKVTLLMLDGSKKKAVCTVTVQRRADSINVLGQSAMAPGMSASYKAEMIPKNTKNKKAAWSLASPVEGVSVSASGKIKVEKSVAAGTQFTVVATALDGSGAIGSKTVTVKNKANSIVISANGDSRAKYKKSGILEEVQIYSRNVNGGAANGNQIRLSSLIDGVSSSDVEWVCSNKALIEIGGTDDNILINQPDAVITGRKAGVVTLTCKAADGSGKKASVRIRVINPASFIKLTRDDNKDHFHHIAAGRSYKIPFALGTAYGKPTIRTVAWDFKIYRTTLKIGEKNEIEGYNVGDDVTAVFKDAVKIDKNGKVSVNAKKWKTALTTAALTDDAVLQLAVTAEAQDGTGFSDTAYYYINQPARSITHSVSGTIWIPQGRIGIITYVSDKYVGGLSVESSNSNHVGAAYEGATYSGGKYYYYISVISGTQKGTGTVKVKALDGTGKGKNLKVRTN